LTVNHHLSTFDSSKSSLLEGFIPSPRKQIPPSVKKKILRLYHVMGGKLNRDQVQSIIEKEEKKVPSKRQMTPEVTLG
jgi:hypothetical protein